MESLQKPKSHMQRVLLIILFTGQFFLLVFTKAGASELPADTLLIKYPDIDDARSQDYTHYFVAVLKLALEKSDVEYSLETVTLPYISESRSVRNLEAGMYTIHWLNSNANRETDLVPIRVPLFKGLIGWRLLFIREEDQPLFSQVKSLDDLRTFVAGQGHDWPDTRIFEANNIEMVTSASFSGLFKMLPAKRIDYFPRSVIEVEREQALYPEMYVEKTLAIHYPSAYYFFVNGDNAELAKKIETGLVMAIKDGAFDKLFNRFYGEMIAKANLQNRIIIRLDNPQKFPLDQKAFWYRLPTNGEK